MAVKMGYGRWGVNEFNLFVSVGASRLVLQIVTSQKGIDLATTALLLR